MVEMFVFSFFGTIGFTFLGCLFSLFKSKMNKKVITFLKGFTFGTIISLLFLDIIYESIESFNGVIESYGYLVSISIMVSIFLLFYLIHFIVDKVFKEKDEDCESHDIHIETDKPMLIAALMFLISVSLHNIPEGLSLGSSFISSTLSGILMSIIVFGLHNFVIGYSMYESFNKSNTSKTKSILLTLSSSIFAYVFAIIGYFIGNINPYLEAIMLSISAGSLLFVILKELLPGLLKDFSTLSIISFSFGVFLSIIVLFAF